MGHEDEVLSGMGELSMSEFVKAHAAGAAMIDVSEVDDDNRGGTNGWVKTGHPAVGGDHVRY